MLSNNKHHKPAMKKYPKTTVLVIVLALLLAWTYSWTFTEHGRLDYRAALSLRLLSFTYDFQPDPDSDFRIPLPVNLIYSLSNLLPEEQVSKVRDVVMPGEEADVQARVYWPRGRHDNQPLPVIVYYHGGGFVVGSVDIFDPLTRALANAAKAIVISVEYRLAPISPWPAAVNDAYTALLWAEENALSLGGDPRKLVVAGDSAGGNLAAVTALKARDEGGPALAAQILYYPATDLTATDYPSIDKYSEGYGLSTGAREGFHRAYVPDVPNLRDAYISPLYAPDLRGLPPALILTAGFDPLTGAAQAYTARLREAGVAVTEQNYADTIHGFMSVALFPQRRSGLQATAVFLQQHLSGIR
ncbi:alpha/beta hydrolase [Mangrovimicrobium sediminis]|uniref:Alpha/beta hydrolase n=1 Tax=Mangrovimicrobium sediminis TaxID=2562682 RepID=A0A4Z0LY11_9GAMM|nr:alpha/beta hydrolase [Haliea sp. SAOS-164]TGD72130.1 alpha/beta hydrolase [Haliea sp. SAOS-164]